MAALAQEAEPITAFGHGGFFGPDGKQIPVTMDFVTKAQAYYKAKLASALPAAKKKNFADYEKRVTGGINATGQDRLILEHQSIEWLIANTSSPQLLQQCAGKLRALRQALNWKVPVQATPGEPEKLEPYTPSPQVLQRLASPQLRLLNLNLKPNPGGVHVLSATLNSGQAYINECSADGVPIPPTINVMDPNGTAGWRSEGFIPTASQFIVNTPAELRSYKSSAPEGMCFALPRYTDVSKSTVTLDGVICMGKQSSKVCFWDNQMSGMGFNFPAGTQIPIGVPSAPGGQYQGGGKELEFGSGGICTDCHAGENPYIIHPKVNLAPSGPAVLWESLSQAPRSLPTMAVNRYDPLVGGTWPQNQSSQAASTLPSVCAGCHFKGFAGRFPHLSNQISQYCSVVLTQAITKTMPPGSPGSAATAANAFRDAWCNAPPNSSSEDTGDPHLTTINNIHYDFQAAGEFTALRNTDSDFELQTRQSPVLTTFIPGTNPYTGLASCVSLNTAAALRVGKRRVTFQTSGGIEKPGRFELRVDGKVIGAPGGYDLGGGNKIAKASPGGESEFQLSDGTRIVITPVFWTSQGYWYLQVEVFNTPAQEGILGPILLATDWLPRAPDGASFGPRPVPLLDRHIALNQKLANAWRVKPATSLFEYAPGASTADFTDVNWPPEPGKGCMTTTVKGPKPPVIKEPQPELAKRACAGIKDKATYDNCIFDVTIMGDASVAKAYQAAAKLKAAAAATK
jgi:hypothetical protein